jgi:hypothetical protein
MAPVLRNAWVSHSAVIASRLTGTWLEAADGMMALL